VNSIYKPLSFLSAIYLTLACIQPSVATEYNIHGIVDLRATSANTLPSYLSGGQGKFASSDGKNLSIAQAGVALSASWDSGFSAHGVLNAYADNEDSAMGFTEAYVKYKGLPSASGYRFQGRFGIFYPEISLENNATAWASKNTLNSSTLNTWIGEEIRVLGSEFKITRLGRLNGDAFDISISATAFINNDPAGALLAWHGWTMSSRQTLWTEKRPFPWLKAQEPGGDLVTQALKSDPFLELDNHAGFYLNSKWKLRGKGEISVGYYDNNATPYYQENGQYGWGTRFYHIGTRWKLAKGLSLTAQYLNGDTLMQNHYKKDIVNNDYANGFVSLTKKWASAGKSTQTSTLRIEKFSIDDNDNTWGDNNNEQGKAITVNHSYRITKHWFTSAEFNWIDSERPARYYNHKPVNLIEKQLQIALRYFF